MYCVDLQVVTGTGWGRGSFWLCQEQLALLFDFTEISIVYYSIYDKYSHVDDLIVFGINSLRICRPEVEKRATK